MLSQSFFPILARGLFPKLLEKALTHNICFGRDIKKNDFCILALRAEALDEAFFINHFLFVHENMLWHSLKILAKFLVILPMNFNTI